MAVGKKPDYPPLLGPGRHTLSLSDVYKLCVLPFANNQRRIHLYHKLEEFVQVYLQSGVVANVWVNGSFMTEKPEPGDVDVTVIVCAGFSDLLSEEQFDLIARTQDDAIFAPDVDAFAFLELSRDHPDYLDEYLNPARTWHEQYGTENSNEWLKGFGILKLRETRVGLRICS